MYDFDKSKRRIAVISGEIEALCTESSELYIEMQAMCIHEPEFVVTCTATPWLRLCTHCGKEEEKNPYTLAKPSQIYPWSDFSHYRKELPSAK